MALLSLLLPASSSSSLPPQLLPFLAASAAVWGLSLSFPEPLWDVAAASDTELCFCCAAVSPFPFPLPARALISAAEESVAKKIKSLLCQECPHVPQLRAALALSEMVFPSPVWRAHVTATLWTENSGRAGVCCSFGGLTMKSIHPSLQASLPCLHHILWGSSGPATLCPTFPIWGK